MSKLLWLTDLHLDFALPAVRDVLFQKIRSAAPDAVLVGGDTGEARSWRGFLEGLADAVGKPVHFVLGNHDYYRSSIRAVRDEARALSRSGSGLTWLNDAGVVLVGEDTVLIGHDGWSDARSPEYRTSDVLLNDYLMIEELRAATGIDQLDSDSIRNAGADLLTWELQQVLHRLGDEAGDHFRRVLPEAAAAARHLVVLTHPPPFRESCWHEGRLSDDNWAPHFVCVAAGVALAEFMREHPDHRMTVLCGHTHGAGVAQILPNITCITGGARYGAPQIQRLFDVR